MKLHHAPLFAAALVFLIGCARPTDPVAAPKPGPNPPPTQEQTKNPDPAPDSEAKIAATQKELTEERSAIEHLLKSA